MTPLRPPPPSARRLLERTLPPSLGDDVIANLDDLHAIRARQHGQMRADVWYWRQALGFPLRLWIAGNRPTGDWFTTRTSIMRTLLQDLRYTLRLHRSRPGFALTAILSLAIAIGFNTAIFSVVDGVLLRPAPLPEFDRLMMIWETDRNTGTTREPASIPDFVDYRAASKTFTSIGALIAAEANLAPPGGDPVRLAALQVTHDLLPFAGVTPIAGRTLTADDERSGARVVLISEALWTRVFDRRADAIGRTLTINDAAFEVVGVVPDTADFGVLQLLSAAAYSRSFADRGTRVRVDAWAPLRPNPQAQRFNHPAFMLGKLAPGVTPAAAQTEMKDLAARLEAAYPQSNTGRGIHVEPMAAVVFGPVRPAFLALLGAVGFVLLVACVNVAHLLLAQGETRRREVAIRAALGAGRSRLARQFFTETLSLTIVAAALGVALAFGTLAWLQQLAPADVPRMASAAIDWRVLSVTVTAAILVGVTFGLVPTLQIGRTAPRTAIAEGGDRSATSGRGHARVRATLVIAELALAVMLASGAGLLIRSFWRVLHVDPGFTAAGLIKAEYQLPASRYPANFQVWPNFAEQHTFTRVLLERTARLPGVASVAIAGNHPLDPGFTNSFTIVGREAESRGWPEMSIRRVTGGYFATVGLGLVRGRLLTESDTTDGAPVVVINEATAERFFPGREPIGAAIQFWGTARRIVGVVGNERFQGLTAAPPLALYAPLSQTPSAGGQGVLLVKTAGGDPDALRLAMQRTVRAIDPGLAVFGVETIAETLTRATAQRRFTMLLVALFALMALGLAALGVHGVLAYSVRQRTREIGIRIALGAVPDRVRRAIVGQGLALAGIGLALGLGGALALAQVFASLLYGVTPTDPWTFAGVAVVIVLVAMTASYLPARWATRIDPTVALRTEA